MSEVNAVIEFFPRDGQKNADVLEIAIGDVRPVGARDGREQFRAFARDNQRDARIRDMFTQRFDGRCRQDQVADPFQLKQ